MTIDINSQLEQLGYCMLSHVFDADEVVHLIGQIEAALELDADSALSSRGTVFAARNLIDSIPDVFESAVRPQMGDLLEETLGKDYGLVRVLYFDKPSDRSWQLPFHKDLTIAVKDNSLPTAHFSKPTHKAGVDHVEASEEILRNMLTLRIHLDDVTDANGPLEVIPGSHAAGKRSEPVTAEAVKVLASAGDVLAMRPMISHASGHTDPEANLRRRILHLEFCGIATLPDQYQWMHFLRRETA